MPDQIEVKVNPESLSAKIEETVEADVSLHNLGQSIDQLNISIEGLDNSWYTLPVSSVALFPNDKDNLKIIIKPPKTEKASAGAYPFKVKVTSQSNPENTTIVEAVVNLQTMPDLEIKINPESITGRRGTYQVTVNNPSDSETEINLNVSDTSGALQYNLKQETLKIPGKGKSQTGLEVNLGWLSFFGGSKEFPFQISATSPEFDEGKTIEGKLMRIAWYKMIPQIRLPKIRIPSVILSLFQKPPEIVALDAKTEDNTLFNLTWLVKRSSTVKLDDEILEAQGEKVLSPTVTASYTLTATNKYGTVSKVIEIEPHLIPKAKSSERIRASLSSSQLRLQMDGSPESVSLQMQNLGDIVDKFIVDIEGISTEWYSRSASSLALMPQATEQVQISFQVPKKKGAKARTYAFAVIVRSQSKPEDVTVLNGTLEILPVIDYKLKIAPYRVSCRKKGKFRVGISNIGTSEARIALEATDLDEGLVFKFKNKEVLVSAWDTIEVPVIVKPKKGGIIGQKKRYDITITTQEASGNSQSANCELYHNPLIGSWKSIFRFIKILLFLAIIGVLIGFVIHWGGGFNLLRTSPERWWHQLTDTIVRTFESWFSG